MNAPVITTTKPLSTKEMEEIAERIRGRIRRTVEDIIETGRDLATVKDSMGFGKFTKWLDREFSMTDRTARNYMRAAAWAEGKTEIISDLSPTTLYLLAAPSTPEDIGKEVIADIEAGKPVGDKQVKARIEEARSATRVPPPAPDAVNRLALSKLFETFEERAEPPPVVKVEAPKPKKPRKPTRAQLEKRKKRLEQAIGFLLLDGIESIARGFFSPTGDHLHSDDFYPAVYTYLDAATADRLVAELTEARATIDQWIDRLKAVKLATKGIVSEAEASAAVDDDPLVIPAVFRREKTA